MILVSQYPERYDGMVIVITTFTAIKWVTLLLSMLIFVFAAGAALVSVIRR